MENTFTQLIEKSIQICNNDEIFEQYTAREKALAFSYTLIEQCKNNSTISLVLQQYNFNPIYQNAYYYNGKKLFYNFFDTILEDGTATGELQARPFFSNYNKNVLFTAIIFCIIYNQKDNSENHEKTDVIIDKSVNFAIDIMMPNAIDSFIDLIIFLYKLRKQ